MNNKNSQHLSVGALIALVKSGLNLDKENAAPHHLSECDFCSRNYESLHSLLQNPQNIVYQNLDQLHSLQTGNESDFNLEKNAAFFIHFLDAQLPEEHSQKLFRHLNDCYPCFQLFARNWNDYLTTNKIIEEVM